MRTLLFQLTGWMLFSSIVALAEASSAQDRAAQPNCQDPQTQLDMNLCAAKAAQTADRTLNQVYRRVRAIYQGTALDKQLIDAQLAWMTFRAENCTFAKRRFEGGSIAPMIEQSCMERLTRQRTEELASFLERDKL
ncbi:lysozyme inhibitor LprI family protein [Myxacorys almedinensis]|uniref:DUF1311 domain-containing protein n=1 Tax=Myxacorys almedinensis A TaxID=2690445 RepID=A0A8J7Z498_9CYAN|nr:lysozyme inhibitor LprI family protein [Myxacorys almedinensis]NDJ19724.1 DUF1311 domain-containing protein [Myxacorys almedinensis A]